MGKNSRRNKIIRQHAEQARNAYPGMAGSRYAKKVPKAARVNESGYEVSGKGLLIHRNAYYERFGKIPKGWHIHHIDEDKLNNKPENLIALPGELHFALHDHMRSLGRLFNRLETIKWLEEKLKVV